MKVEIQDIETSISIPTLIKDDFIRAGSFYPLPNGGFENYTGGLAVVYPVNVKGEQWGFRCWSRTINDTERLKIISEELKKTNLPYFVEFVYCDVGIVVNGHKFPTTRMRWVDAGNIVEYICKHRSDKAALIKLARDFYNMTLDLHRHSIAHGDLQHGNILVYDDGRPVLIDYDSLYLPALNGRLNEIDGHKNYQHPSRVKCKYANEKLDYFSEVIIFTTILAIAYKPELLDKYKVDADQADSGLFRKEDFHNFLSSRIYDDLHQLGGIFPMLLSVIQSYLEKDDINVLEPLEQTANLVSYGKSISIAKCLDKMEKELSGSFVKNLTDRAHAFFENHTLSHHSRKALLIASGALVAAGITVAAVLLHPSAKNAADGVQRALGAADVELITGTYSLKGQGNATATAVIEYDEVKKTYSITVFSAYRPFTSSIVIDEGAATVPEIGSGTATLDDASGTITIILNKDDGQCILTKYL